MKTEKRNQLKKYSKIAVAVFASALLFTACKKDSDNQDVETAKIGFVHASPGTVPLDVIFNNQRSLSLNYTNDKGYFNAYPGSVLIGVTKKDSTKYITNSTSLLKPGNFYSAFVVDTLKSTKILVIEDDLSTPETDKAKVRFINLSPGSPKLSLNVQGSANALFADKAFKEATPFSNIAAADSYTFEVKETGTTAVKATLPNIKIEKGKIYTIWAKGLSSATDSTKFGLAVMPNK
jgi:hypothetical protein